MRIWTRKSPSIQPRTSLRKSDVSWLILRHTDLKDEIKMRVAYVGKPDGKFFEGFHFFADYLNGSGFTIDGIPSGMEVRSYSEHVSSI